MMRRRATHDYHVTRSVSGCAKHAGLSLLPGLMLDSCFKSELLAGLAAGFVILAALAVKRTVNYLWTISY